MQASRNEKVRMAAAMRLSEILMAREQRELAELRAAQRRAEADTPVPIPAEHEGAVEGQEQPSDATVDVQQVWRELEGRLKEVKGDDRAAN
jgi:hypothetical protein